MKEIVKIPFLGVNDLECKLTSIEVEEGAMVKKGTLICIVETTKTSFDIESPIDGYFYCYATIGDILKVGSILAIITSVVSDKKMLMDEIISKQEVSKLETVLTKKAEILVKSLGLDSTEIIGKYEPGTRITEDMVKGFLNAQAKNYTKIGINQIERVGIIGGVGGGGAMIIIDSILNAGKQRAVCIFDKAQEYHNKEVLGVPVVGGSENIPEWIRENRIDSVVIAFNRNLNERMEVYKELSAKGIPFTNVIDLKADIRTGVKMGLGNVILGHAYIGPCSLIGDNNFISANVFLEHGNVLGSHCAFGPGVFTSGNVSMGNKIRFATGIFIEPGLTIGDNAVIASGNTIIKNVGDNEVVKHKKTS